MRGRHPYPFYGSSGVEWIGDLPSHWQVLRLRYACDLNPTKAEIKGIPSDTLVTFLPMEKIGEDGSIALDELREVGDVSQGYTYFRDHDVIVAKITPCFENGKGALVRHLHQGIGFGTTELHVLRAKPGIEPRFIFYLTRCDAFRSQGTAMMYGAAGQQRVPEAFLRYLWIPVPSPNEQRAIADFLDRETARIDALITKKQRLIELLQEKRTALISHAVTKGLDAGVAMKESGVAWMGEVPAHWEIKALGHALAYISYGFTNPMPTADGGPYMLTANDIGDGVIKYDTARRTTEDAYRTLLTDKSRPVADDILLTKDGTLGRVAVADDRTACINQSVAVLRVKAGAALVDFVQNLLRANTYQDRMIFEAGGTTIKHIYITRIAKMPVAWPPIEEQHRIAQHVNSVRNRLDITNGKIQQAIERLQEYRTALISAAVTGKIDVREEAAS